MLSPSTPSRSASRTASATTRCLLSPATDAIRRCSLAATGLLAHLHGLTIVRRTAIVRCTTYGVRAGMDQLRERGRPRVSAKAATTGATPTRALREQVV